MPYPHLQSHAHRQSGAALIVSLTLLLVVTVTGLAAAGGSTLQLGMAGATKNRNLALQAAESALNEGERRVAAMAFGCGIDDVLPPAGGSHYRDVPNGGQVRVWDPTSSALPDPWNAQSWANATPYERSLDGVATSPRFRVALERVESADNSVVFRVTAAAHADGGGHAVVESTVRRRFERRIQIRGNADVNLVAIGDGLLTARAQLGSNPDLDISLGGWQPDDCNDDDAPVTLAYEGTGGTDAFVVADILGLGYAPGVDGLLDVTSSVTGLDRALSDYRIERIEVENSGSTAVAITTLGVSGRFTTDNSYCINTASDPTGPGVLDQLISGVIGGLLPTTALDDVLSGVAGAGTALVGADGVLPLVPANASIIADISGNDRYEIYSDTTTAAFVTADIGGDDSYHMRAIGDGFVQTPVIIDVGGSNHYDVAGGHHIRADLAAGALSNLESVVNDGAIGGLLGSLSDVLNFLGAGKKCGALDLLCHLLSPLANLLNDILDAVAGLFDSHVEPGTIAPVAQSHNLCSTPLFERVSWRERLR